MLVLSRKENERILIGDSIVITVVRLAHGAVRLGIEAPDEVRVMREELLRRPTAGAILGDSAHLLDSKAMPVY